MYCILCYSLTVADDDHLFNDEKTSQFSIFYDFLNVDNLTSCFYCLITNCLLFFCQKKRCFVLNSVDPKTIIVCSFSQTFQQRLHQLLTQVSRQGIGLYNKAWKSFNFRPFLIKFKTKYYHDRTISKSWFEFISELLQLRLSLNNDFIGVHILKKFLTGEKFKCVSHFKKRECKLVHDLVFFLAVWCRAL